MKAVFDEQETLCTIAGGLPATFPYEKDFTNPETEALLKKYLNRNPNIPIEDQIKFWYQFIDYTCSHSAGYEELRELPRRRISDHGADRHHDPV